MQDTCVVVAAAENLACVHLRENTLQQHGVGVCNTAAAKMTGINQPVSTVRLVLSKRGVQNLGLTFPPSTP